MLRAIGKGAVSVGAGVGRAAVATARFAGRATMQALERIVPHGANELGSAIYTGSAYAPPGVTERLMPERGNVHVTTQQAQGNVHGTGAGQGQPQPQPPPITPPQPQQPRMSHPEALQQARQRAASQPQQNRGMER